MKPARILIAEDSKALKTVVSALYGYDQIIVSTVKEAQRSILEDGIDLFIMGIHFDDSRATELASLVRESPKHATTPVLLVRVLRSSIAKFIRSTSNALKISGSITDFFGVR